MLRRIAIGTINLYQQYFRAWLPSSCRFTPSCSEYARQAIEKYGVSRGLQKVIKRLLLCHPFSKRSGFDPLR